MPIYEYSCRECGEEFEKLMRMGASPPPCPACRSAEVRKLVSASSFVLKGSGWYRDSYGLKPSNGKESTSAESSGSKPVSTSTPADTKSESKAA